MRQLGNHQESRNRSLRDIRRWKIARRSIASVLTKRHTCLIPDETRARLVEYLASLQTGNASAGKRLRGNLSGIELTTLTEAAFLDALLNTKPPLIFAESAVAGDGSDWNLTELGILGDISIAAPVTIYDNGHHTAPVPHAEPFTGTLVFTPSALLRNGPLNREGYYGLYLPPEPYRTWDDVVRQNGLRL